LPFQSFILLGGCAFIRSAAALYLFDRGFI